MDLGASPVDPPIPRTGFPAEGPKIGNSPFSEALPRKYTDLDFCLVQPASVGGSVMNGEAVPDLTAQCEAKCAGQRLAAMNMEVVHHEMDRLSCRVLQRQFADDSRKLKF